MWGSTHIAALSPAKPLAGLSSTYMDCQQELSNGYDLLFKALSMIPISHYILCLCIIFLTFFYNLMECHFLHDLFTGFRGDPVILTYGSGSVLYKDVVSKCNVFHGRHLSTPWLSGPHIQTAFLTIFGRAPACNYRRQLFYAPDGGTIALDWLINSDVSNREVNERNPIAIIVPGLSSDSSNAYIKHIASKIGKRGWNVVVSNHRGTGGIAITSDCFYNAGWTEDVRRVISYINHQYPHAPLFAIGTSIGANILVKYLGEEGTITPLIGAASIFCPWDIVICDRFLNRKPVQQFYNRILTIGLQGYAKLHQSVLTRLANWDGITKSRWLREFDHHATRILGKYETVDMFYRHCSSVNFLGNVSVPLLGITALDDPLCTKEAIPWDECRANENIIFATTQHGGHLAGYEGIFATSLWWVRAVDEFFAALHSSPHLKGMKKMQTSPYAVSMEASIDRSPYVNVTDDGLVAAVGSEQIKDSVEANMVDSENRSSEAEEKNCMTDQMNEGNMQMQLPDQDVDETVDPMKKLVAQLSRYHKKCIWFMVSIAIVSTSPWIGSTLLLLYRKRAAWRKK